MNCIDLHFLPLHTHELNEFSASVHFEAVFSLLSITKLKYTRVNFKSKLLEFKSRIGLFLLGIFCEFNNSNIELKQAKTGKGKAKFVRYLNPIQSKLSIKTSNEYKLDLEFHSKKSVVAVFSGEIVEQVTVVEIEIVWWVRLRLCGFSTFRVINELYSKPHKINCLSFQTIAK